MWGINSAQVASSVVSFEIRQRHRLVSLSKLPSPVDVFIPYVSGDTHMRNVTGARHVELSSHNVSLLNTHVAGSDRNDGMLTLTLAVINDTGAGYTRRILILKHKHDIYNYVCSQETSCKLFVQICAIAPCVPPQTLAGGTMTRRHSCNGHKPMTAGIFLSNNRKIKAKVNKEIYVRSTAVWLCCYR